MATKKKKPEIVIDDTVRTLVNSRVDLALNAARTDGLFEDIGEFDAEEIDNIKQLVTERMSGALVEAVDGAVDLMLTAAAVFSPAAAEDGDEEDDEGGDEDEEDEEDEEEDTAPSGRRRFQR